MIAVIRLALATVAAVGLYGTTLAISQPQACAAPSPSCGGDLRDCLRLSADMNPPAPFGVRYVSADQVARCMEVFNSCIHGGASRGGNGAPPASTSAGSAGTTLPQRFHIGFQTTNIDCQRDGDAVSCKESREEPLPNGGTYVFTGEITGTLSGLTLTGTRKAHSTSSGDSSGCVSEQDHAGPVRFEFSPDGSVAMHLGPTTVDTVFTGACSNAPPMSETHPVYDATGTWSGK